MNLKAFLESADVDYSSKPASTDTIGEAERALGLTFGPQLREYLSQYGYLGCGSVEFYGMNERQKLRSDLVTQTKYLHEYFPDTWGCAALENLGEGAYALVDRKDSVRVYYTESGKFARGAETLNDYILRRFREAAEL